MERQALASMPDFSEGPKGFEAQLTFQVLFRRTGVQAEPVMCYYSK
jgi:hypothetical protein